MSKKKKMNECMNEGEKKKEDSICSSLRRGLELAVARLLVNVAVSLALLAVFEETCQREDEEGVNT